MTDTSSPPTAGTPPTVILPLEATFIRPHPLTVVLVGAGGTGARLAPDIARLLGRGDRLYILDHDTVEEKNLIRQHFIRTDLGRHKAEVVAKRALAAASPGVLVDLRVMALDNLADFAASINPDGTYAPPVWVGAVDTRAVRRKALEYLRHNFGIWIDAGNELRGGQVGLIALWPLERLTRGGALIWPPPDRQAAYADGLAEATGGGRGRDPFFAMHGYNICRLNPLAEVVPTIFVPDPVAEGLTAGCALRLDTQSLAANVSAYAGIINTLSRLIDGVGITTGMHYFSTANVTTTKPFLGVEISGGDPLRDGRRHEIVLTVGEPLTVRAFDQMLGQVLRMEAPTPVVAPAPPAPAPPTPPPTVEDGGIPGWARGVAVVTNVAPAAPGTDTIIGGIPIPTPRRRR